MSHTSVGRFVSLLAIAGVGFLGATASAQPASPRYVVTPLAPGLPARLNDSGEIAGRLNVQIGPYGTQHAAVFRGGAWVDLGVLEDDTLSVGLDINNFGVVVGVSTRSLTDDTRYRAIQIAADGTVQALLPLAGKDAWAVAINDMGQICGQMGPPQPDAQKPYHAFITDGTSLTDLHPLVEAALGETRSRTTAFDINGFGDVVGRAEQNFTPYTGFVYRGGSIALLEGTHGAGTWSLPSPLAVNDSGLVVGEASFSSPGVPPQSLAVVYDTETRELTPLPAPAGGLPMLRSGAYDIDAAGRVVGEAYLSLDPYNSRVVAFLYEDGEMLDLNTLIPPGSGWDLRSAIAINEAGQIVGSGTFNGQPGFYYVLLTPANEPPTVTLEASLSADEGSSLAVVASGVDPEGGPLVYDWDLDGDGDYDLTDAGNTVDLDPAGDDGPATRPVGVLVTDEAGSTATAYTAISILNVAPTATLSASATTLYVNEAVDLALTNPFDPSVADTSAGFSHAWDCSGTGFAAGTDTHVCAYGVGGVQTARARIADKDDGVTVYEVAVEVRTLQQGIAGLTDVVLGFGLPMGPERSFLSKLEDALAALQAGDVATACGDLQAFINHAQAQSDKELTVEQASLIIAEAEKIRAALGCA